MVRDRQTHAIVHFPQRSPYQHCNTLRSYRLRKEHSAAPFWRFRTHNTDGLTGTQNATCHYYGMHKPPYTGFDPNFSHSELHTGLSRISVSQDRHPLRRARKCSLRSRNRRVLVEVCRPFAANSVVAHGQTLGRIALCVMYTPTYKPSAAVSCASDRLDYLITTPEEAMPWTSIKY
jgi:hypothetical protein